MVFFVKGPRWLPMITDKSNWVSLNQSRNNPSPIFESKKQSREQQSKQSEANDRTDETMPI